MDTLNFFTTLRPGWFNAWIPAWGMVLIQFVFMALHREGGRRAVDTSWYTPTDRRNAAISSGLQIALLILSVFVPLKSGAWLTVGAIVFGLSLIAFIAAFLAYGLTPQGQTVTGGIYRLSRNPMYFAFFVGMIGTCIASASLWLLLVNIPFMIYTHLIVLGEERYCEATYGDEYRSYKARTPRYFLFA